LLLRLRAGLLRLRVGLLRLRTGLLGHRVVDSRLVGTLRLTLRHVRSGHSSASLVASTSAPAVALNVGGRWLMRGWLGGHGRDERNEENLPSFFRS
jgi:hypothetical protein